MVAQSPTCPWCGTAISSQKFEEIAARIREEEQNRLAETEAHLRQQLSGEQQAVEKHAADQVAAANAQRDAALQKVSYATKLRQDQLDAQADHAILTTAAFPTGKKELCIESDIIVVNPARAVPIVHLLRRALISMHVRGLSLKARAEKTERLYALMNSAIYQQRFDHIGVINKDLLEVDVEEKEAHDKTWKKRGKLLQQQGALLRELDTEISAIIEGTEESHKPAA